MPKVFVRIPDGSKPGTIFEGHSGLQKFQLVVPNNYNGKRFFVNLPDVAPRPYTQGDLVTWKGSDEDVPTGTVGCVLRLLNGEDVEVAFPVRKSSIAGPKVSIFTFSETRLCSASDKKRNPVLEEALMLVKTEDSKGHRSRSRSDGDTLGTSTSSSKVTSYSNLVSPFCSY